MSEIRVAKTISSEQPQYDGLNVIFMPRWRTDPMPWLLLGTEMRWRTNEVEETRYSSEFKLGHDSVRTGDGTGTELALAATVAIAVAKHYSEPFSSFFVAGHEHEQLPKGGVSVAWEGGVDDWPYLWMQTREAGLLGRELDVHFDALTSWGLAVLQGGY